MIRINSGSLGSERWTIFPHLEVLLFVSVIPFGLFSFKRWRQLSFGCLVREIDWILFCKPEALYECFSETFVGLVKMQWFALQDLAVGPRRPVSVERLFWVNLLALPLSEWGYLKKRQSYI
jgi:hypothetical protein